MYTMLSTRIETPLVLEVGVNNAMTHRTYLDPSAPALNTAMTPVQRVPSTYCRRHRASQLCRLNHSHFSNDRGSRVQYNFPVNRLPPQLSCDRRPSGMSTNLPINASEAPVLSSVGLRSIAVSTVTKSDTPPRRSG